MLDDLAPMAVSRASYIAWLRYVANVSIDGLVWLSEMALVSMCVSSRVLFLNWSIYCCPGCDSDNRWKCHCRRGVGVVSGGGVDGMSN